ncbi:MAG: hypothetical protein JO337_10685, partial [Acidimicrobiales bacterium]|nr:hypothetical protein [Acidimicrobiales bacterium]
MRQLRRLLTRRNRKAALILRLAVTVTMVAGLLTAPAQLPLTTGADGKAQLIDSPANPYLPGELWGGGSPVEDCWYCDPSGLIAHSGSQSTKPGQPVDPMTGDFSSQLRLFDIPALGGNLDMTLTYDTQRADNSTSGGTFGYGWQSVFSTSISASGGTVLVNEQNGAQIVYSPPVAGSPPQPADGCISGDYQDIQKYTIPGSVNPYCAANRVDAQLGYFPNTNSYQLRPKGGRGLYVFSSIYGVIQSEGDGYSLSSFGFNVAGGTGVCPSGNAY